MIEFAVQIIGEEKELNRVLREVKFCAEEMVELYESYLFLLKFDIEFFQTDAHKNLENFVPNYLKDRDLIVCSFRIALLILWEGISFSKYKILYCDVSHFGHIAIFSILY